MFTVKNKQVEMRRRCQFRRFCWWFAYYFILFCGRDLLCSIDWPSTHSSPLNVQNVDITSVNLAYLFFFFLSGLLGQEWYSTGRFSDVQKGRIAGTMCSNKWEEEQILNERAGLTSITWRGRKTGTPAVLASFRWWMPSWVDGSYLFASV